MKSITLLTPTGNTITLSRKTDKRILSVWMEGQVPCVETKTDADRDAVHAEIRAWGARTVVMSRKNGWRETL